LGTYCEKISHGDDLPYKQLFRKAAKISPILNMAD